MILQNRSSLRVDCDPITGRQKWFTSKHQSQNTRSGSETRCQQKLCSEKNIISKSYCRAQQRLINLTTKSKNKNFQPKLLPDNSDKKNSVDPEPPFICKVQNYEDINALKTKGKITNAIIINNGYYEYYPKDPINNCEFTFKKTIINDNVKVNQKSIKEKNNNSSQTVEKDLHSSSTQYLKKSDDYKKIENITGTNEKTKTSSFREYGTSCVSGNNSKTSEKLNDSTLKNSQQWFDKNELAVSKVSTENKQIISKNRPLKISEALELHERENDLNFADETGSISKSNESKDKLFPSRVDNVQTFENLKIAELNETFLVEKLKNPMKIYRNICTDDKTDWNKHVPGEVSRNGDWDSEFSYNDLPKFTDLSTNGSSAAYHGTFRSRNSSNDYERFSFPSRSLKADIIQKRSSLNTFTNSRNGEYCENCKSRSPLPTDYSTDNNNNILNGLSDKYTLEKINYPKGALIGSSQNLLSSQDFPFSTAKGSFVSEKADAMRNFKGLKQSFNGNYPEKSDVITNDKRFPIMNDNIISRKDLSSKFSNVTNDIMFTSLPVKEQPKMKKLLNLKALSSKSEPNDLSQNISWNFVPRKDFEQKWQHKVPDDCNDVRSALNSVNEAHKEDFKTSCVPSSKDVLKEYDTSHQQTLRYAKSFSNFSTLKNISYKNPARRDTTRTSFCLAQQRLLSCKKMNK